MARRPTILVDPPSLGVRKLGKGASYTRGNVVSMLVDSTARTSDGVASGVSSFSKRDGSPAFGTSARTTGPMSSMRKGAPTGARYSRFGIAYTTAPTFSSSRHRRRACGSSFLHAPPSCAA